MNTLKDILTVLLLSALIPVLILYSICATFFLKIFGKGVRKVK